LNWNIIWTAVGLAIASFFILPFYIAMLIAYKKSVMKIELEFVATANQIQKKVKFDDAVERLFEEGEAI
jgi:hypothetical protein